MKTLLITTFSLIGSFCLAQEPGKRPEPPRDRPARRVEQPMGPDFEAMKTRIKGAVERGDMTREQAEARLEEVKRTMEANRPRPGRDGVPPRIAQDRERAERQGAEDRERAKHHQERIEAIERSLHQAAEAGLLPEIEVRKTMARLHLTMIKHEQRKKRSHR